MSMSMSIITNPALWSRVPPHRRWALQFISPSAPVDTTLSIPVKVITTPNSQEDI